MTKTDIKKLLGTPEFKNGDPEGEQWGYHKMIGDVAGPEPVLFLVTFDKEGKVIAYDTVKEHHRPYDLVRFVTKFLTHGLVNPESSKDINRDFGCSSICTLCDNGTFGIGRNFDWTGTTIGNMVVIHSHPKSGYSSVSSFYIPFLGFGDKWKPESMQDKFMLLASLYGSLDGMNEKGLYVADLVAGDQEETHQDSGKPAVTTTLAIRLLLNKAAPQSPNQLRDPTNALPRPR